jgi:hypothetical protein
MIDIGQLLFVDLLRMYYYPGGPFTGNIVQDIVMLFFIPTLVTIVFAWSIARIIPGARDHGGLRWLFIIAIYLFMIFQGWFAVLASAVEFYFIFLIAAGVFLYIGGHFHGGVGAGGREIPGRGMPGGSDRGRRVKDIQRDIAIQEKTVERFKKGYDELPETERGRVLSDLIRSEEKLRDLYMELEERSPSGRIQSKIRELDSRVRGYR